MRFLERMQRAIAALSAITPIASLLRKLPCLVDRDAGNSAPARLPLVRIEPRRLAERPTQSE
jgi:hypothetical protein